ncbi:phage tail tape measure protein [Halomonas sp. SL1]|uniref:phage tail tape measure protein n=1 Tax=Halomonas sp. SL1 TaxID=2137478 RepID=UPI000D1747D2|nr:phage tail tape measure protein [Halomonas sp. SL1]RAH37534.1 hypothetical protein C9J49_011605 [Halomonas sp. SL1]
MARDLKLQVVLDAVDRATRPLKQITQGSGRTAEALKASREQLKTLERAQRDLRGFRDLKRQSESSSRALEEQQQEIRELSRQMNHAEGDTRALGRQRDKAVRQAQRLKEQYQQEQRQLDYLRRNMTRVEGVTGSHADQQRELTRRIREANGQLEAQQRQLRETAQRQRQAADAAKRYQRAAGRASSIAGNGAAGAAAGGVALTAMTHQAFGNQMSGARLAAQFGEGDQEATRYRDVITEVYRGGRGEGLDQVTQAVGAIGASFGSLEDVSNETLSSITRQALTLSDVFGIDITEAAQTADIMVQNGLADNASAAFDLIGRSFQQVPEQMRQELPEILHEYSTNFRALGFDGQEAMGLLVAAAEQGKFALDKTGDSLKEFTIRGSDMSKASREAYEAVGLDAQTMADAIASGGDQARQAMHTTARAILDIEDPARRANTAIALFGTPIEDLSVDQIPKFLQALTGAQGGLGDVTGAVDDMATTLDDNAGKALQRVQRVLAGEFMGVLDQVDDDIIAIARAVTGWIDANPELARTLVKVSAGLAALVAVGGGFMVLLGSVLGPIALVNYVLTLLSLNPVSLTIMGIVAAVAALAVGATLIYRNWDGISAWFGERWADIKAAFAGGIGSVMRLLLDWSPIGLIWRGVTAGLEALGVEIPEKFGSLGSAMIDGMIDGLTGKLGELRDRVTGMAGNVRDWFANKLDINSPSRVFAQLGGHTVDGLNAGLDAQRDEPARRVGEIARRVRQAGAGLAIGTASLPAVADVPIDNRPPLQAAGGGGDVHITIEGGINVHAAPGMDEQALARMVDARVRRALEDASREAAARRRSSFYDID